jgi:hypothetical protein
MATTALQAGRRRRGVTWCVAGGGRREEEGLQVGAPLAAAAGTKIAVTENVRYWHAVAAAMLHNKQTLQSADAGSKPGWCILTTVATKLAASHLQ